MKKQVLLLISFTFLLIVSFTALQARNDNRNLEAEFETLLAAKSADASLYDYQAALTEGTINPYTLQREYFSYSDERESFRYWDISGMVLIPYTAAPKAIRYYRQPGDKTPAYVIEKGTYLLPSGASASLPYHFFYPVCTNYDFTDLRSLPTADPDWRLVYPMDSLGQEAPDELLYVKLSDLEFLMEYWMNTPQVQASRTHDASGNAALEANIGPLNSAGSDAEWIRNCLFEYDEILYRAGVYLSPNLYRDPFPGSSWILLGLALLCIGIWICVHGISTATPTRFRSRRK